MRREGETRQKSGESVEFVGLGGSLGERRTRNLDTVDWAVGCHLRERESGLRIHGAAERMGRILKRWAMETEEQLTERGSMERVKTNTLD